jgi:hypothetical protein
MIDLLINRKFPKIGFLERNAFIGEFVFGKLIMPILSNPDYNGIVSSGIISVNTRKNLFNINQILKKISRSLFFDDIRESHYTIFNTYLIEIMPVILKLFENLGKIKLPEKIEEYLSNPNLKLTSQVCNNYFSVNKGELVHLQSICFSVKDLMIFCRSIKSAIDKFAGDKLIKLSVEKIEFQENFLLSKLKESREKFVNNYYVIFNTIYNPIYQDIFNPKVFRFTFANSDLVDHEFTLIRIKYCIKVILRSLNMLNRTVYYYLDLCDTCEMLFLALNKIINLEDFSETTNDKIPLSWYSMYLNSNLTMLKEDYQEKDFNKLYQELLSEARTEIETLTNKSNLIITRYGMNMRCAEKINDLFRKETLKLKQIEKFIRVEKFIENCRIHVCVRKAAGSNTEEPLITVQKPEFCVHRFTYLDKVVGNAQRKSILNLNEKNAYIGSHEGHCISINDFIRNFQNFKEIKEEIVMGDCRYKIFASLEAYLNIVRENMINHPLFIDNITEENISLSLDDIENYILEKVYMRIYPESPIDKDHLFFELCCKLEWVSAQHLEVNKKFVNERLWAYAINNLNRMDLERSPMNKLKCVQAAYKIINNCIKFCSGKDEGAGVDDIIPILIYIIIHSKPKRIFSNMHYIKAFMNPGKLLATYGFLLTQIEMATEFIFSINHTVLKISKEEFERYEIIY